MSSLFAWRLNELFPDLRLPWAFRVGSFFMMPNCLLHSELAIISEYSLNARHAVPPACVSHSIKTTKQFLAVNWQYCTDGSTRVCRSCRVYLYSVLEVTQFNIVIMRPILIERQATSYLLLAQDLMTPQKMNVQPKRQSLSQVWRCQTNARSWDLISVSRNRNSSEIRQQHTVQKQGDTTDLQKACKTLRHNSI